MALEVFLVFKSVLEADELSEVPGEAAASSKGLSFRMCLGDSEVPMSRSHRRRNQKRRARLQKLKGFSSKNHMAPANAYQF